MPNQFTFDTTTNPTLIESEIGSGVIHSSKTPKCFNLSLTAQLKQAGIIPSENCKTIQDDSDQPPTFRANQNADRQANVRTTAQKRTVYTKIKQGVIPTRGQVPFVNKDMAKKNREAARSTQVESNFAVSPAAAGKFRSLLSSSKQSSGQSNSSSGVQRQSPQGPHAFNPSGNFDQSIRIRRPRHHR